MPGTVYFVTAITEATRVGERVIEAIPIDDRFELANDRWMVSYEGSAQNLAEKVGVRGGDDGVGNGLVIAVTSYSGRASSKLWDWLRVKGV